MMCIMFNFLEVIRSTSVFSLKIYYVPHEERHTGGLFGNPRGGKLYTGTGSAGE